MPRRESRARRTGLMVMVVVVVLAGCTRVIDHARPQMERTVAPIAAGQVDDLLSKNVRPDGEPDLFAEVEPERCTAAAREVNAPFIFDGNPAASSGGDWDDDDAGIVEIVGVYHSDYDPTADVDRVRRTIESCRDQELHITASSGATVDLRVQPRSDSDSPQIALWSLTKTQGQCDDAFIAAHNAAIEITTCWAPGGYDVLALARDALTRINALADMTS
ncbi:sensor domain-containing protein [Mycolicibacterium sp.]|uniref:sensor domain-containing protein n=1 Tax=Mycolicibacterium sp. TaxID=2320850 RepID=UPI001A349B1E|nr:sensor domain-containing protein [Mycolicibacterium sp.]MBJ7337690.1 sensor domain-containing protein [Mycolicibacterium sp.]